MKKLMIYSLSAIILFTVSCRKSDNPKLEGVQRVPLMQFAIDPTGDQIIKDDAPDAFAGKFTVSMYYPDDVKPAKVDIVVIKNDSAQNIQVLQKDVTTFPANLTVTGTQLKALFGNKSTKLGESYRLGANITTKEGKVYPAFSTTGSQNNPGIGSLAGATPTIVYGALCGFHMEDYGAVGATVPYVVKKDEWADYGVGDVVNVKIIDATHLSFEYAADDAKPIIIAIDPATNKTSVVKQTYGDYVVDSKGTKLTFSVESVAGSADNQVLPCQTTVSVRLAHTSSAGSYGSNTITLQRQ